MVAPWRFLRMVRWPMPAMAFMVMLCLTLPALAQPGLADTADYSLADSEQLTFATVLQVAMDNAPMLRNEDSLQAMARAYTDLGSSWTATRPSLQMNYYDDSPLDDVGLRELETGLSFNLWRRGERNDTASLASNYQRQFEAWQDQFRLDIAGRLRSSLNRIDAARTMLTIETGAAADAGQLVALTTTLVDAGAAAQGDLLQARNELLQQQRIQLQAETELAQAELAYTVLTGINLKPAGQFSETAVSESAVPQTHPTLRFLQAQSALAMASVEVTRHQASGRPSVSVGVRRERGDRFQPYTDSIGIAFSIPIGSSPAAAASVSVARSGQVEAEIRFIEARRQLNRRLVETRQEIVLLEDSMALAEEQVDISAQRYQMALTAFEAGEMNLTGVVLAQQQARRARREFESLRLRLQQLNSQYNQIVGVLP